MNKHPSLNQFTLFYSISILLVVDAKKSAKRKKIKLKTKLKPSTSKKISDLKIIQKPNIVQTMPKKVKKHKMKEKKLATFQRPLLTEKPIPKEQERINEIPDELNWIKEDPHELLLSRFVETPKGTKLGESIGIYRKRIILKNKLNFYSIPLDSIREKGAKLVLRRKVDWKKAAKLGEIWRKNTLDIIEIQKHKQKKSLKKKK